MAAVESCVVWKSLKSLNLKLKQREKLLTAICMTFQETVEGNSNRSTVGRPQDFVAEGDGGGLTNGCPSAAHESMGQYSTPPYGDYSGHGALASHTHGSSSSQEGEESHSIDEAPIGAVS